VRVFFNKGMFVLEVPTSKKKEIAPLMAYRGLAFSTSGSTRDTAVLFSSNPYALADLAPAECVELAPYKHEIDLSRALDGKGTTSASRPAVSYGIIRKPRSTISSARRRHQWRSAGAGENARRRLLSAIEIEAQRNLVIVPGVGPASSGRERIREWSIIPNVKCSVMLKVKDGIHPTAHYQMISYEAARNPGDSCAQSRNMIGTC
jgi:hypothetical protein